MEDERRCVARGEQLKCTWHVCIGTAEAGTVLFDQPCCSSTPTTLTHLQRSASATASASACVGSGAGTMPCSVRKEEGEE